MPPLWKLGWWSPTSVCSLISACSLHFTSNTSFWCQGCAVLSCQCWRWHCVDIETNWFWIAQTFLAPAAWCPAQLVCSVCAVHGNSALCLSHFHNSTVQCGLYTTVHNCTGPCLLPQQNCTVHTTSSFYRNLLGIMISYCIPLPMIGWFSCEKDFKVSFVNSRGHCPFDIILIKF